MNKEERVKLVFETISKIAGFEIKPDKDFYIVVNGKKSVYLIDVSLNLHYKTPNGYFGISDYNISPNISPILKGEYQLEEIKEPLLTDEGRNFLRQFKFDELSITLTTFLNMYDEKGALVNVINLKVIGYSFDGLKDGKKYSREELGL